MHVRARERVCVCVCVCVPAHTRAYPLPCREGRKREGGGEREGGREGEKSAKCVWDYF